jgi:hypothetical protein
MSNSDERKKAVLTDGRVELFYRCKIYKFNWEYKDLIIATDADGEVWAFNIEPTKRTNAGEWDCNNWQSYERCIGGRPPTDVNSLPVKNWENSVVSYYVEVQ